MITYRRKFATKITIYGISSFHFYRLNQLKVIPLDCTFRTRNLPKFSATPDAGCNFANVRRFGIGLRAGDAAY